MTQRVMLFIDYQNAYQAAREVFHDEGPRWFWQGQFNPQLLGEHRVEVAAWNRPDRHCRRLTIPGRRMWCHWLDQSVYESVADPTDYTRRKI